MLEVKDHVIDDKICKIDYVRISLSLQFYKICGWGGGTLLINHSRLLQIT